MMRTEEIEIEIDESGHPTLHVKGVNGKKCLDLTKDIEEALGKVVKRDNTSDYFRPELLQSHKVQH